MISANDWGRAKSRDPARVTRFNIQLCSAKTCSLQVMQIGLLLNTQYIGAPGTRRTKRCADNPAFADHTSAEFCVKQVGVGAAPFANPMLGFLGWFSARDQRSRGDQLTCIASQAAGLFAAKVRYRRAMASEKLGHLRQSLEARTVEHASLFS